MKKTKKKLQYLRQLVGVRYCCICLYQEIRPESKGIIIMMMMMMIVIIIIIIIIIDSNSAKTRKSKKRISHYVYDRTNGCNLSLEGSQRAYCK